MDRFFVCRRRAAAALLTLVLLPAAGGGEMQGQPVFFSMIFPQLSPGFGMFFRDWLPETQDCAAPSLQRREVCL